QECSTPGVTDVLDVDTILTARAFPEVQYINPFVSFQIGTSAIKVSCVIERDRGKEAVKVIHDKFGLDQPHSSEALTST
ncbi:MAG: hypothetical protein AAGA67_12880, partial [Cyanobacteria bacterium P01_F01_bin.153]